MQLLSSFDINSDFYSDPQLKTIFQEEYNFKVPSKEMWAIMLYIHPDSKYYSLDDSSRIKLIASDYYPNFDPSKSSTANTIEKVKQFLLTKSQRSLINWEIKLEERDAFIASLPYNESNYELLDKMMASTAKMWDQYQTILKKVSQENDSKSLGDTELSLQEKGII